MATKKASSTKKKAPAKKTSTTSSAAKTTVKTVSAPAPKAGLSAHIESSLQSVKLWRALAAEFLGTFLLASVVIAGQGQPIFVLFALVGIVLLIGAVSGAHVNPAITIGAWATRRIGWLRAVGYILVQILGAAAAFFAFNAFIGGAATVSEQQQLYGQTAPALFAAIDLSTIGGKEWFVFFSELLGTAILGLAVANATRTKDRLTGAFTVGLGIFIALMVTVTVGGYVSASAILNPAVALALQAYDPAVWAYAIYALAPVIGGVIGFIVHDLIRGKDTY
ncbi:MAG: aquaporin [Candidatus Microsaccharimonas sp.]